MLEFLEKTGPGIGSILIKGLRISQPGGYNPLGKLWACGVRKSNHQRYGVDVVGLFTYDYQDAVVSCSFCLNYCEAATGCGDPVYTSRFQDSFTLQMLPFESIIESFVDDTEFGLAGYERLVEQGADAEVLDKYLEGYLRRIGFKKSRNSQKNEQP